ncbi:MAG: LamG domain-containing protein [Parcubacteria group bacterium]|nr:LamG domain-containing protein [Parcubacteria group bacterium]
MAALSYTAYSAIFSQPTRAQGLVGHWGLGDEDEVMGSEISANSTAVSDGQTESNSTSLWNSQNSPSTFESTSAGTPAVGSYHFHFVSADGYRGTMSNDLSSTQGQLYKLTYRIKVVSGTASVELWNGGANVISQTQHTTAVSTYTKFTLYAARGANPLRVLVQSYNSAAEWYIDDISVKAVNAADLTPYANNGTVYGAAYTTDRNGQSNNAMDFDGTDDYINVGGSATLKPTDKITVSAWVYVDTASNDNLVAHLVTTTRIVTPTGGYALFWDDRASQSVTNSFRWVVTAGDNTYGQITTQNITNGWHHVVGTYDKDLGGTEEVKLYVDGAVKATGDYSSAMGQSPTNLFLGSSDGTQEFYNGSIADVRIYNRALSAAEVLELYGASKPVIQQSSTGKGLVGQWSLSDESQVVGSELFASFVNHPTAYPYETLSTSGRNITSAINTSSYGAVMSHTWGAGTINVAVGDKFLFTGTLTLNSGENPTVRLTDTPFNNPKSGDYTIAAGRNAFIVEADTAYASTMVSIQNTVASNWSMTDVSFKRIYEADSTPYGNNGTAYGAAYTTDRQGQSNNAMSFDGTNDYVEISDNSQLDFERTNPFSIAVWAKTTNTTDDNFSLYEKGDFVGNSQTYGFAIRPSAGNVDAWIQGTNNSNRIYWRGAHGATITNWNHYVMTYDGSSAVSGVSIYINDRPLSSSYTENTLSTSILNNSAADIGTGFAATFANGSMSDVRIYDRALSAAEVSELYGVNKPVVQVGALQKGLVGRWSLGDEDEVLGSEMLNDANAASDLSGNEANATTGWAGTATVASSSSDPSVGTYHFNITGDAATYLTNGLSFTSGKRYKLLYRSKVIAGAAMFHISDTVGYGWNDNRIDLSGFGAGGYNSVAEYFTANATAVALNVWVQSNSSQIYIDNFSLKEVHAADATPNATDGTVYGATYATDRNGLSNRAMDFDGTDDYIDLKSGKLSEDEQGTITAWVKMDSGTGGAVFGYGGTSGGNWPLFRAGISGNEIFLGTRPNGLDYEYTNAQTTLTNGVWYHLAWVSNGTTWYLYVNGQSESYTMGYGSAGKWFADITESSGPKTLIGAWFDGNTYQSRLDGQISDLRVYNRALSAAEVEMLYQSY